MFCVLSGDIGDQSTVPAVKAAQKVEVFMLEEENADGQSNWRSEAVEAQVRAPPRTQALVSHRILLPVDLH